MRKGSTVYEYSILKRRALSLIDEKMKIPEIAKVLGVEAKTVYTWQKRYKAEGEVYLLPSKMGKGKKPFLGVRELEALAIILVEKTAEDYGFEGNFWTRARVGAVIEKEYKVSYKERSVGDVLKRMGFSLQKPQKKVITKTQKK